MWWITIVLVLCLLCLIYFSHKYIAERKLQGHILVQTNYWHQQAELVLSGRHKEADIYLIQKYFPEC